MTVLASPFVGVSNDALVLLRRAAPTPAALHRARARAAAGAAPSGDERLLRAFRQRYDRLAARRRRRRARAACEQIVCRARLRPRRARAVGRRRRYANLRKLARLARSYEELRGPDIEGFVRFVAEQDAVGAPSCEAVAEEEGADAVRLLTIHAAKGLEFKVVVVADAGRDRAAADGRRDPLPPGRALRLPGAPIRRRAAARRFDYEEVQEAEERAEEAERLRLYYVAMTRAIDRLIVSGCDRRRARRGREDADRLGARRGSSARGARRRGRAGRARARRRAARCCASTATRSAGGRGRREAASARGGERAAVAVRRERPTAPVDGAAARCRWLDARRAPLAPRPAALVLGARALRALLVPLLRRARRRAAPASGPAAPATRRPRRDRDRRRGAPAARAGRPRGARGAATRPVCAPGTRRRPTRSSSGSAPSSRRTATRRSRAGSPRSTASRPERPFAFEHDGVLLHGRLDVLAPRRPRALVVDYKTNVARRAHAGGDRRGATTGCSGSSTRSRASAPARRRSRSSTSSSSARTRSSSTRVHGARGCRRSRRSCPAAIARIQAGRVPCRRRASSRCAGCPALDLVCAGPLRPAPARRLPMPLRHASYVRPRRGGAVGPKRRGSGRSIERLAAEHADAAIALTLPQRRSSCSSR